MWNRHVPWVRDLRLLENPGHFFFEVLLLLLLIHSYRVHSHYHGTAGSVVRPSHHPSGLRVQKFQLVNLVPLIWVEHLIRHCWRNAPAIFKRIIIESTGCILPSNSITHVAHIRTGLKGRWPCFPWCLSNRRNEALINNSAYDTVIKTNFPPYSRGNSSLPRMLNPSPQRSFLQNKVQF